MKYPHTLILTQSLEVTGTQDPETGLFVPDDPGDDPTTIYEGKCDAQEMGSNKSGAMIRQDDGGLLEVRGELEIYIRDESGIQSIKPGITGTLTRGSKTQQVTIKAVRELDGALIADSL